MVPLAISFASLYKITTNFFFSVLPNLLRFLVLVLGVGFISYRRIASHYKYMSMINNKSFKFVQKRSELKQDLSSCTICLWDIREGEVARTLQCGHTFHGNCLDQWLRSGGAASCPLCRTAVLPPEVVADYELAAADSALEKELGIFLLSTLQYGSCCHHKPTFYYF